MKYLMSAEWWKAAGIRAAKTMFQTGAALVVTQMPGGSVDWMAVGSAVIVAGVASLGTSLAGLPELEKGDAKATFDEDGSVTYAKPVRIPGAVSLSMDANGEIEPFYADNIAYYVVNNNSGYEGDLEIALIPESFLTDIMHEELDGNGVLAENANVELEHFAFLFEFDRR